MCKFDILFNMLLIFCLICLWLANISLSTKKNITLCYWRRIIHPYFLSCSYHGYTYNYGHSAMPKGLHSIKTLWALNCKISVPKWQAAECFIMEKLWCFGSFYKIKHLHRSKSIPNIGWYSGSEGSFNLYLSFGIKI